MFAAEQLVTETKEHTKKFVNTLQETADHANYSRKYVYRKFCRRFLLLIINYESVAFENAKLP